MIQQQEENKVTCVDKLKEGDTYPLDLSQAYVHQTFKGGIFTIIYSIGWVSLVIFTFVNYILNFTQIDAYILEGHDYDVKTINYNDIIFQGKVEFNLNSEIVLEQQIKEFNNVFYMCFSYSENGSNIPTIMLLPVKYVNDGFIFEFSLKNDYFITTLDSEYPNFNILSCKDIKWYKEHNLININDPHNLLSLCNENTSFIYDNIYYQKYPLKLILQTSLIELDTNFNTIKSPKTYEILFKPRKTHPETYSLEQIKLNVIREHLFSFKSNIYINFRYPQKEEASLTLTPEYILTVLLNGKNTDLFLTYTVLHKSFINAIIELGALLKFLGILLFIPELWNKYYRQKAFLTLSFYFKRQKVIENIKVNDKDEKVEMLIIDSGENSYMKWKRMKYLEWLKATYCWCCCCNSNSKNLKKEIRTALNGMESTTFIRYNNKDKWIDIRQYIDGTTFE